MGNRACLNEKIKGLQDRTRQSVNFNDYFLRTLDPENFQNMPNLYNVTPNERLDLNRFSLTKNILPSIFEDFKNKPARAIPLSHR